MSTGVDITAGISIATLVSIRSRVVSTASNTCEEVSIKNSNAGTLDESYTLSVESGGAGTNSAGKSSSLEVRASGKVVESTDNTSSWLSGEVDLSCAIKLCLSLSAEDASLELSVKFGSTLSSEERSPSASKSSSAFTCKYNRAGLTGRSSKSLNARYGGRRSEHGDRGGIRHERV